MLTGPGRGSQIPLRFLDRVAVCDCGCSMRNGSGIWWPRSWFQGLIARHTGFCGPYWLPIMI